jgi:DNA mismatch repair protein MutL
VKAASKPVRLLDSSVAQRIAAGEVIERPESIVRELMDNAIDAGADSIDVYIQDGGIKEIKVIDNGGGMSPEDLALCCRSHATSKIENVDDLYALGTLGFRGEALYSISACTRLSICSRRGENVPYTLTVNEGRQEGPLPGGSTPGTTVTASDLFYSIPGRRKFLKRSQAETAAAKKTFLDKALPFYERQFTFAVNGAVKVRLTPATRLQRVLDAYQSQLSPQFMRETSREAGDFSLKAVCSTPELFRSDRTGIQIFVNNRRIQEYSLIQAVTYGYTDYLPGGCFPYCCLFIEVDPELVDFNIHPAKREAKIRNLPQIHHETVEMIRSWVYGLRAAGRSAALPTAERTVQSSPPPEVSLGNDSSWGSSGSAASPRSWKETRSYQREGSEKDYHEAFDALLSGFRARERSRPETDRQEPPAEREEYPGKEQEDAFIYRGQLFNLFLIAEQRDRVLIIDQHAAHERIIYDELSSSPAAQRLLIPYSFEPDPQVEEFLIENISVYRSIGIEIEQREGGCWDLTALPSVCRRIQDDIIEFMLSSVGNAADIQKKLYALISCRAAVKDGDVLDGLTARELIRKTLSLAVPRCPHGRPLWKELTKEELYRAVERIV